MYMRVMKNYCLGLIIFNEVSIAWTGTHEVTVEHFYFQLSNEYQDVANGIFSTSQSPDDSYIYILSDLQDVA